MFNQLRTGGSNALLVIAPRHPERFDEVERLCKTEGLSTLRRTELAIDAEPRADAVVLDPVGELPRVPDRHGRLRRRKPRTSGGHNILEPAAFGKPIVIGPYMENFSEIVEAFLANDAAVQVRSVRELTATILSLMGDPVRRARLGAAARALVEANRGAKDETLAAIARGAPSTGPRHTAVVRPFRVVH